MEAKEEKGRCANETKKKDRNKERKERWDGSRNVRMETEEGRIEETMCE